MGLFDGKERVVEITRQGGRLEKWYSNSKTPLIKAVENALLRDGKDIFTQTDDEGKPVLEYLMFHNNDQLKVIIMENECLGLCFSTIYPVDTGHLTRNDIDAILQAANAKCKTGMVMYNEEIDIFSYIFAYDSSEFVSEGISIDVLLCIANDETNNVLDYLDILRDQFNLHIYE